MYDHCINLREGRVSPAPLHPATMDGVSGTIIMVVTVLLLHLSSRKSKQK
jgi:hypothetical protein